MKKFLHSRRGASKGAALIIVLAIVVIATGLGLAYFSRTTTDRQLAQTSYNDTSADLLARSGLDIVVSDFKQEIINANNGGPVTQSNIQPQRSGNDASIPNLIRRSVRNDPIHQPGVSSLASSVSSTSASANGRSISLARWNSHYLIPPEALIPPEPTFTAPDWVLLTGQGPNPAPLPKTVIGRYAFAVYDEGGLIDVNLGGVPTYASLDLPGRSTRRLPAKPPSEESEIMLAAFTPNDPCSPPKFTPDHINVTLPVGAPCSLLFNTNHNPDSFSSSNLPRGLSMNTTNGNITGIPTEPGFGDVTLKCQNECGNGTAILHLTIYGFASPQTTPWPVNLARKGTFAFADLTTLPSTPALTTAQVNKLIGWRNYATTQQTGASFDAPSFPSPAPDTYARYFLGAVAPFRAPYTGVSAVSWSSPGSPARTDQAVMTRQELIRLQRTLDNPTGQFPQSLLQYLGTFSRDRNRPARDWPAVNGNFVPVERFDMNNLQILLPNAWIWPGHYGQGHAYGLQRSCCTDPSSCPPGNTCDIARLFGLDWVPGRPRPGHRLDDPNYYGHWHYDQVAHPLTPLPAQDPNFFQIIDYAMNQAIGVNDPNHVRNTFQVGAALIDQYDTDDVWDGPDPNGANGNTITIIDYDGNPLNYAYGIEALSFTPNDPLNVNRPWFAPYPPPVPANYVLLNRRFESVGEFGYAYNPASTTPSRTLDFASATSNDRGLLDFFTYNSASSRAGIVNLNTRNAPVLASIIRGAWLHDPGYEILPPDQTYLVSQSDALAAGQAIVGETTSNPVLTRADVARLAAVAGAALPVVPGAPADEAKQTIARALAEVGQARTWNLMIDVIAQTGNYLPGTVQADLTDPTKFIVQGEKRYWLHIALDRDDGTVLGTQLEEVFE